MIPIITGNPPTHLYSLQELTAIAQIAMKGAWDAEINSTEHLISENTWQYHHSLVSMITMQNSELQQLMVITFKDDYDYIYAVTLNLSEGNYQSDNMKEPESFPTDFLLVNQLNERDGMTGNDPEDDMVICPICKGGDENCLTCGGEAEITLQQMMKLSDKDGFVAGKRVYCGQNNANSTLEAGFGGIIRCGECMETIASTEFTDNHF